MSLSRKIINSSNFLSAKLGDECSEYSSVGRPCNRKDAKRGSLKRFLSCMPKDGTFVRGGLMQTAKLDAKKEPRPWGQGQEGICVKTKKEYRPSFCMS